TQQRTAGVFPNSIGATTFDGRIFRCDSSLAVGSQCTWITASHTTSTSAPHSDSRSIAFEATTNNLLESDDGGIFRRTTPTLNTGDWFSVNGTLQVTEHTVCAFDAVASVVMCANQDNGVTEQS